jgi:hypothetical protein
MDEREHLQQIVQASVAACENNRHFAHNAIFLFALHDLKLKVPSSVGTKLEQ